MPHIPLLALPPATLPTLFSVAGIQEGGSYGRDGAMLIEVWEYDIIHGGCDL